MVKSLGLILALFVASTVNAQFPENFEAPPPSYDAKKPLQISNMFAHVDYENERIVITANVMNKEKPAAYSVIYGGRFSPAATAYLKPLNNSPMKAFVQVRCADMYCQKMVVYLGLKNSVGNPYAYNEQRLVLFKNGIEGAKYQLRELAGYN